MPTFKLHTVSMTVTVRNCADEAEAKKKAEEAYGFKESDYFKVEKAEEQEKPVTHRKDA